jgi:hypothetical protein
MRSSVGSIADNVCLHVSSCSGELAAGVCQIPRVLDEKKVSLFLLYREDKIAEVRRDQEVLKLEYSGAIPLARTAS